MIVHRKLVVRGSLASGSTWKIHRCNRWSLEWGKWGKSAAREGTWASQMKWRIDRTFEMTSDAPSQMWESTLRQTLHVRTASDTHKMSVFWLVQMILCVIMLPNFPFFVGPNVISDGSTNGLSKRQLRIARTHFLAFYQPQAGP